jgi:hypothetical protein
VGSNPTYCVSGPMAVIPGCRFTLDDSDYGVTRVQ